MTVIKNKYVGFTHPFSTDDRIDEKELDLILEAWKNSNCSQGIHLWDEVLSGKDHYLCCDACGIDVYIEKIVIPDGKDDIING